MRGYCGERLLSLLEKLVIRLVCPSLENWPNLIMSIPMLGHFAIKRGLEDGKTRCAGAR